MRRRIHWLWLVGVVTVVVVFLLGVAMYVVFSETAYEQQTLRYNQALVDAHEEADESKRVKALKELARKVGAGSEHTEIGTPVRIDPHTVTTPQTQISESELAQNILNALQTRASLSGSKAAAKSNKIAFAALALSVFLGAGSLAVAIIALVTARRTGRKRLEIEQEQEADRQLDRRKATITAKFEHLQQAGHYALHIENGGASEARDVTVVLGGKPISELKNIEPKFPQIPKIGPGSIASYSWQCADNPRPPFPLKITWSDDSKKPRCYRTTLMHPTTPT